MLGYCKEMKQSCIVTKYADRAVHENIDKYSQLVWNIDRRTASIKPKCSSSCQQQHACPESSAKCIQPTLHLVTQRAMQQLPRSLLTFSSQLTKFYFGDSNEDYAE